MSSNIIYTQEKAYIEAEQDLMIFCIGCGKEIETGHFCSEVCESKFIKAMCPLEDVPEEEEYEYKIAI